VTKVAPEHEGWLSYRRQRPNKGPDLPVVGLELSFEEPVRGPIALGALSHFGLGLFLPVDGS
jgi:CRISPR-associated protein Csb2